MAPRLVFSRSEAGLRMQRRESDERRPSNWRWHPAVELHDPAAAAGNKIVMVNDLYQRIAAYTWEEKKKMVNANPTDPRGSVNYNLRHLDVCMATARSLKELEYWETELEARRQGSFCVPREQRSARYFRLSILGGRRQYLIESPQDPESQEYRYTHARFERFLELPLEIRRQIYGHLIGPDQPWLAWSDFRLLCVSSQMHEEYLQEIMHHHWFLANIHYVGVEMQNSLSRGEKAIPWPHYARAEKWRVQMVCGLGTTFVRSLRRHIEIFVLMLSQNKHLRHLEIRLERITPSLRWTEPSCTASHIYSTEKHYPTYEESSAGHHTWTPACGHVSCGKNICLRCPVKTWTIDGRPGSTNPSAQVIRSDLCDAQYLLMPFAQLRGLMSVKVEGMDDELDAVDPSPTSSQAKPRWIHPMLHAWKLDLESVMQSSSGTKIQTKSQQAIVAGAARISGRLHRGGWSDLQRPGIDLDDDASEAAHICDGRFHADGVTRPSLSLPVVPYRPWWGELDCHGETGQPILAPDIADSLCRGECLADEHEKGMILAVRNLPECPLRKC